ncbi:M23 family metallopeptidase [Algoriphagus halophytocola]|uniref:M23 family metallopeptidase n=1 Tax=Algoriphagus halophytocola TaxID=2991499 RepID=A0ABY6MME8_9BACT|nr:MULTISPECIES: M23 family metallopeptidase [unclassified Algoriphagus]UZD24164.1 M23 family metallopeptidase [Algoriphagus sp. TR-M5]WBL41535.1 M23 family metallopeptidase [Algoriphagus sp. TR-M9]
MKKEMFKIAILILGSLCSGCKEEKTPTSGDSDIFVALPSDPVLVENTSGDWLVYDLHIIAPTLHKVDILDQDGILLSYTDFINRDDQNIASIWLEFEEIQTGSTLRHEFNYVDANEEPKQHIFELLLPTSLEAPKTIDFPVPSGIWLAEGAPSESSYHTRAIFPFQEMYFDPEQKGYLIGNNPQRYAIDYVSLENGLPYKNDGNKLTDWYCYGMPILAVEGGKVLLTENAVPDNQTPGKLDYETTVDNVTGNVVYIEHEDGSIGTYCHMIPGSVIVNVGDQVEAGQELGKLGNSGNSFAPHLHMHVMANPTGKPIIEYSDGLYFESLPYRYAGFEKLGSLVPGYLDHPPLAPFVSTKSESFVNSLPAESDVIEF